MGKKVNKLSDLDIDEVSLVDRGANQHAAVEFYKNLDGEDHEEGEEVQESYFSKLVSKVLDLDFTTSSPNDDTMSGIDKAIPGQNMPYGQQPEGYPEPGPTNQMQPPGMGGQMMPEQGMDPNQMMPEQGMMPGEEIEAGPELPEEVLDYIQDLEDQLAELTGQPIDEGDQPMQQEEQAMFGKNYTDEDEVAFLSELAKSLHDEDQRDHIAKAEALVRKANERAEAAETIAKAERDHRLTQEYIAKARSFTNLPVSSQEFGPVLKRLHETMDEADVAIIEKALSTANESVSNFFGEIGKRGDNVFINDRLESVAKSMVDADPNISVEQARARALERDPSLYDEFLQDQGR